MKRSGLYLGIIIAAVLTLSGCARLGDFFSSLNLKLESIEIAAQTIETGQIVDLVVTGYYATGSQETITTDLTWLSDTPAVATVTAGTLSGVAPGETIITVTYDGRRQAFTDTAVITVVQAPYLVTGMEIDQPSAWIASGDGVSTSTILERSTDLAASGSYSMKFAYDTTGGTWGIGPVFTLPGGPMDLTEFSGLSLRLNPNGVSGIVYVGVRDGDGTIVLTAAGSAGPTNFSGNNWIAVAAPFDGMGEVLAGSAAGLDLTTVSGYHIVFETGVGTVYIDDMYFE